MKPLRALFSRAFFRRRLTILALILVGWVVLVTALHLHLNRRVSVTGAKGAAVRSIQVGGLPVT